MIQLFTYSKKKKKKKSAPCHITYQNTKLELKCNQDIGADWYLITEKWVLIDTHVPISAKSKFWNSLSNSNASKDKNDFKTLGVYLVEVIIGGMENGVEKSGEKMRFVIVWLRVENGENFGGA